VDRNSSCENDSCTASQYIIMFSWSLKLQGPHSSPLKLTPLTKVRILILSYNLSLVIQGGLLPLSDSTDILRNYHHVSSRRSRLGPFKLMSIRIFAEEHTLRILSLSNFSDYTYYCCFLCRNIQFSTFFKNTCKENNP
jgi:hypothetical protein